MTRWVRERVALILTLSAANVSSRPVVVSASERAAAMRFVAIVIVALTALMYAPSLRGGYMTDDFFHLFAFEEFPYIFRHKLNLFGLITDTAQIEVAKKHGILPWWTSPEMRINFFRPIPSITHYLDFVLFGRNAAAAHLHSVIWYCATVWLTFKVFQRVAASEPDPAKRLRPASVLLGVAAFAFSSAHAVNVHWLSNRNELIATCFTLLGFLAYLSYRETRKATTFVAVVALFALSLLSKESALVFPVLIGAHGYFFRDKTEPRRFAWVRGSWVLCATLFAIAFAYTFLYFRAGHGAHTLQYLNPFRSPHHWLMKFLVSAVQNAAMLATSAPLQIIGESPLLKYPALGLALLAAVVATWALAWKWLRGERAVAFFAFWTFSVQAIATASFPDPRLLFVSSIGFTYVIGRLLDEAWSRKKTGKRAKTLVYALFAAHLVAPIVLVQATLAVVNGFQTHYQTLSKSLRSTINYDRLPAEGLNVFFVAYGPPETTALCHLFLRQSLGTGGADNRSILHDDSLSYAVRLDRGMSLEKIHYHALSFLPPDARVEVVGRNEITIEPREGPFLWSLFDHLYLTERAFKVGQTFSVGAFKATVETLGEEQRPKRVRFTFEDAIDSPRYKFLRVAAMKGVEEVKFHGTGETRR